MSAATDTYSTSLYASGGAGYLDSGGNYVKQAPSFIAGGCRLNALYTTHTKGTESDGTIIRLFRKLDPNIIPIKLLLAGDAIAGLTVVTIGLYLSGLGNAALSSNCFHTGLDMHSGAASLIEGTAFNGMASVGPSSLFQQLFLYAGETVARKHGDYDLALTLGTGGANTGKITALLLYVND